MHITFMFVIEGIAPPPCCIIIPNMHAYLGFYKKVFHSTIFVHGSILFFANIPPFGNPTPRLYRPLYCALYSISLTPV